MTHPCRRADVRRRGAVNRRRLCGCWREVGPVEAAWCAREVRAQIAMLCQSCVRSLGMCAGDGSKAAEQTFWRLSEWSPSGRSCTILRRLRRVALRATVLPYSRPRRTANTDQCCAGVCFRHSARLPASAHRARARSRCHAWAGRGAPCRPTRVYLPHPRPPTARRGLIMRVASVFGLSLYSSL